MSHCSKNSPREEKNVIQPTCFRNKIQAGEQGRGSEAQQRTEHAGQYSLQNFGFYSRLKAIESF